VRLQGPLPPPSTAEGDHPYFKSPTFFKSLDLPYRCCACIHPDKDTSFTSYSRITISGTGSSGRKPVSRRFFVRSDSFCRQNLHHSAGVICERELYACCSLTRFSKFDCIYRQAAKCKILLPKNADCTAHLHTPESSRRPFSALIDMFALLPVENALKSNSLRIWKIRHIEDLLYTRNLVLDARQRDRRRINPSL
jgi:hypothetical protein